MMKPCWSNRKPIAWLASGALDTASAATLREHLACCEGCRRYLEELSQVTAQLPLAAPDPGLEVTESFHERLAAKLAKVEHGPTFQTVPAWLYASGLHWRVAFPAGAALVVALSFWLAPGRHPVVSPAATPVVRVTSLSVAECELAPTLANYQAVASQSLEKLDALLTKQGNEPLPPAPLFTAARFDLAHPSF